MVDIAVQLYTVRSVDEPLPELLDRVGAAGFDGVEFAYRVRDAPTADVLAALDRNELAVASAHVPIESLEDDYEATLEFYDALGADTLVVPWLDPEEVESEAAVDAAADRLNALVDRHAATGSSVRLAYHNHDQEFQTVDGAPAMERLLARTDDRLGFEIDVGWAQVGGADPVALIDRYAGRITHVHVADVDVDRGESVALGDGDVDLDAVVASARRADAEWLVYEHDDPKDPVESIERGARKLREALR
ncbi:sugar phosphate isomerase/epimerase family protein [Halorubrum sp. DTA46]|uniref:sugar phosphate isomerase/epimerase family protein n=1 Tax=Halorubrum sp. DTA46 TaxID=3402162 RepID=UPI003AB0BBF8